MSRRDAAELDPGVLEDLVQPRGLALAVVDLRLAIPGQVAQRADRLGRHEARLQQAGLQQLAEPLRVLDVGLASGDLLDVPGVDEHQLEAVLEHRPHRLPVHAGRLHRDLLDPERLKPVAQRQQTVHGRLELRHVLLELAPLPDTHARGHARLVHVQRARTLNDPSISQLPSVSSTSDRRPREPRITKRCCSACSWQQSGVPAKAPTPDLLTGSRAPSGSRRRRAARRSSPAPTPDASHATPISPPPVAKPAMRTYMCVANGRVLAQVSGEKDALPDPRTSSSSRQFWRADEAPAPGARLATPAPPSGPPESRQSPEAGRGDQPQEYPDA